jgi:hypothetical protein
VGSQKSAASSKKETESERSDSGRSISPLPAISPGHKRKRDDVEDSGASKPTDPVAEELKRKVLLTPTKKLAPLAREFLYFCVLPIFVFFRILIFLY